MNKLNDKKVTNDNINEISSLIANLSLSSNKNVNKNVIKELKTAIIYDEKCLLHQANYAHVESPKRMIESKNLLMKRIYGNNVSDESTFSN